MNINILEIVVIIVTLVLVISGYRRGFVRKLASMLSLVLSIALVSAILPYVTDFIRNNTSLYDYIVEQCEQVAAEQLGGLVTGALSTGTDGTGTASAVPGTDNSPAVQWKLANTEAISYISASGTDNEAAAQESLTEYAANLTREEIKELMEEYGYGDYAYLIDSLSDEELEEYKEQYLSEIFSEEGTGSLLAAISGSVTLDESTQTEIIENLPIPEVIKNLLIQNNNEEGYESLNVSTFQDYIIEYLATLILNVVSFLVAVLLVNIVLRVVIMLLNALAHFPVIGFVNRLAGAGLGVVEALFVLWLFFLLLTVLQTTEVGTAMLTMVEQSSLLMRLYESNLFLRIVVWAAAVFA